MERIRCEIWFRTYFFLVVRLFLRLGAVAVFVFDFEVARFFLLFAPPASVVLAASFLIEDSSRETDESEAPSSCLVFVSCDRREDISHE